MRFATRKQVTARLQFCQVLCVLTAQVCLLLQNYMVQSLEMGHPQPTGPKYWRRNVGTATRSIEVTAAERDNVMHHNEGSDVFRTSYLDADVPFDVQNVVLGEPMQNQLLKMLSHVCHTRDPRARRNMVPKSRPIGYVRLRHSSPRFCLSVFTMPSFLPQKP